MGPVAGTEIIGTEGKLAINTQPMANLVHIHEPSGIRREIPPHYYGRFRDAFITEANEFTACCLDNTEPPLRLEGAVAAVRIGCALQESLITGKKIDFNETGQRPESVEDQAPLTLRLSTNFQGLGRQVTNFDAGEAGISNYSRTD